MFLLRVGKRCSSLFIVEKTDVSKNRSRLATRVASIPRGVVTWFVLQKKREEIIPEVHAVNSDGLFDQKIEDVEKNY